MEIRVLENIKEQNKLSFILKDSLPVFANTLRRLMMNEVPTMAIENVMLSIAKVGTSFIMSLLKVFAKTGRESFKIKDRLFCSLLFSKTLISIFTS